MIGRDSGRKTTVRSMRFRNSGRNARATACSTLPAAKPPDVGENPTPGPEEIFAPRFEVMTITAWRKSAALAARVAQPAVVEDLQEQVPDARVGLLELVQQHDRERLAADPGHERGVVDVAVPEHPAR